MSILQTIEQKFGFQYPTMYRQLFENGMLNWGKMGSNWYLEVFPKIKENPPLGLFFDDFEIVDFERIIEEIESFYDSEQIWDINPDFLFVPFAQNGAGDWYCFFYDQNNPPKQPDIPIVLLWHDSDKAQILAKNLQDFIFRSLIESVVDIFDEGLIYSGDFYENIANFFKTHSLYLSENQNIIIKNIFERKITTFDNNGDDYKGLISKNEAKEIIKKEIDFQQFDETFNPCVEVERELPPLKNLKGALYLRILPIPPANSPIYNDLKALNWRQNKNFENGLEYFRKLNVFVPANSDKLQRMNYLIDNFKDRLEHLKNTYEGVEVIFESE